MVYILHFLGKLTCLILLSFSLFVLVFVCLNYQISSRTLSSIGYVNQKWFGVWGVATGIATFLGVFFVAHNSKIKLTCKWALLIINTISSICVIITAFVYGNDTRYFSVAHIATAAVFGSGFVISFTIMLALQVKQSRLNIVFVILLSVCGVVGGLWCIVVKMTALAQLVGLLPAMLVLFYKVATKLFQGKSAIITTNKNKEV